MITTHCLLTQQGAGFVPHSNSGAAPRWAEMELPAGETIHLDSDQTDLLMVRSGAPVSSRARAPA